MGPIYGGAEQRLPVSSLAIKRINSLFGMIPAAVCPLIVFSLPGLVFRESEGGDGALPTPSPHRSRRVGELGARGVTTPPMRL